MEIVRAAPELAGDLTRIALAAKRHWQYPERWIEIWTPALTIAPDYVATNPTFAAVEAGDPLGFYALVPAADRSRAQLDHLWILPERIGNGLGRALFEHAVATARSLGAAVMDIEAPPGRSEPRSWTSRPSPTLNPSTATWEPAAPASAPAGSRTSRGSCRCWSSRW